MSETRARMPIAEYHCPACGVLVPNNVAEATPRAFHCPNCDANVIVRDGHLHLVFGPGHAAPVHEDEPDETPPDP